MNYASHDPGACIMTDKNGKLEYLTISDERLSRVKNSYFFPIRSIKYCFDYFGIKTLNEIDHLVMDYGFNPQLANTTRHYRKLEADYIKMKLNIDLSKIVYAPSHHIAHAASTFYPSRFEDAAVLVIDGFGSEVETNSIYIADYDNGIKLLEKYNGQGIGLVYSVVTNDILNFGIGEEGKTMGLAPCGRNVVGDPILAFNPVYEGIITDFSEFMDRAPFSSLKVEIPKCNDKKEVTNDFYSKIAFELQQETERCILHLANHAYKISNKKRLCIAGGVGLNCVANEKILSNTPFEEIFIQPAASDTGIAFGLALWWWSQNVNQPRIKWDNAYTGIQYGRNDVKNILDEMDISFNKSDASEVAKLISNKNIVGWFTGGSEIGPRALGHRSILGDPPSPGTGQFILPPV
tara:strand:- start:5 stop:1222 length:1218 start_codon:yes stop_codon:yes gene_type:complete